MQISRLYPVCTRLGLKTNRYWTVHREIDQEHLAMGIDLIPQCDEDSALGKEYSRIAYETSLLYGRMLDSWCTAEHGKQEARSLKELVAARR